MISECNSRHLSLMQYRIKQYREGQIRISELINDLEVLLTYLEMIDKNWKNSFLSLWDVLEIEYASALYNGKSSLDDRAMVEIDRSLKEIEVLINSLLMYSE